uniref:tRNA (32-2'-O)-methyltransferase regulator THADA n=1 Tax=Globodera pallida TaxID=36090 RepID=A0A183BIM0_GLOPA
MSTNCCHFKTSQSLQEILFSQSKPEWLLPCCGQHGGFLSDHCVSLVVQEAICWATDAPRVLRCSTVLTRISSILIEFCSSLSNSTQSLLLSHCLRFLDFPYAESIGYQCAALLMNLVALHATNCVHCLTIDKGCEWLLSVGHSLCGAHTELFSKIRIKALHSLLHCSVVEASLSLRDRLMTEPLVSRLYAQIGHAPLSIQISKVIVDDCSVAVRLNRPNRLTFHMDWIKKQLLATEVDGNWPLEVHEQQPRQHFLSGTLPIGGASSNFVQYSPLQKHLGLKQRRHHYGSVHAIDRNEMTPNTRRRTQPIQFPAAHNGSLKNVTTESTRSRKFGLENVLDDELNCAYFTFTRRRDQLSKPEWLLPCCGQHGGFLSDHCVSLVVQEAICWATDAPRVLRCSTVLTRISSILIEFCSSLSNSTQSLLLSHCLRFLDFPYAESIGYQCAALLMNLVALHATNCVHCLTIDKDCEWLLSVGHSLCGAHTELFSKIRIKALHSLLHCSVVEASLSLRDRLMTEPLVSRLYAQIGHAPLSIQISKVIVDDCSVAVRLNRPNRLTFHMDWIKKQLLATEVFVRQAIEQKLLPALLKSPESRRWFRLEFHSFASLPRDSAHSPRALCTLLRLAIDRIGNEEGNCDFGWEDFVSTEFSDQQNGGISADFMEKALFDGPSTDSETQLSALSLICSHPKGARPVSARECQIVRQFIAKSFDEPSPSVRQHILTQIAKLLSRVSEHSKSLQKINDVLNLTKYRQFVHDIEQLALDHLPDQSTLLTSIDKIENDEETANGESDGELGFSCRVFALMLISLIHSAQLCDLSFAPFEWKALIASLDDQFELCQARKFRIAFYKSDFTVFLENTKKDLLFANPHSPRHQLAVEYRLRFLLPRLSDNVRLAFFDALIKLGANVCEQAANVNGFDEENPNLIRLVQISPQLHAILSALLASMPHIFRDDNATNIEPSSSFLHALLSLCHCAAQLVSPVVHSLSPEGFLPSIGQSNGNFEDRLFSCCQRLVGMPSPNSLSTEQMIKIGEYFWLQLTECRHCGAFEAAADAFRVICIRFWAFSLASDQFPCSPAKWLQQIVDALTGKISARHLCPSRRSAGLPHLVNALLCSEPPLSPDRRKFANFDHTVSALLDCRRSEDRQLECHCVNVLRLLFSQSLLEERIFPYVEEAFQLSLNGCADEFWPVRNAHVQLFAVLIERVFGTPPVQQRSLHIQIRCKMSAHEFFGRYPSLYHSLGNCLHELRQKKVKKNFDFFPHNELQQIVTEIVEEIEQIQQNDNWNYATLEYTKNVEWNLLEFNLHKMGNNDQKWEEIDQLRGESQKAYSNWYSEKNEEKKLHFEKVIGKLIEVLRGI